MASLISSSLRTWMSTFDGQRFGERRHDGCTHSALLLGGMSSRSRSTAHPNTGVGTLVAGPSAPRHTGGIRSLVSPDLAPAADHLLVITPVAGPVFGPAGQTTEVLLRRELRRWQEATGGKAPVVRPNRADRGPRHPLDLFDASWPKAFTRWARAQAERLLMTRAGMADLCGLETGSENAGPQAAVLEESA